MMINTLLKFCLGLPLALVPVLLGSEAWAGPAGCSTATLKGTYIYNHVGTLDGEPYAESGREVYDGKGRLVLTYRGSDGSGGSERATYSVSRDCVGTANYPDGQKATSFISPDGSRFTYTITAALGRKDTALSGMEIRVAP